MLFRSAAGHRALGGEHGDAPPTNEILAAHRAEKLAAASIEAAVLERTSPLPMTWRVLPDAEVRPLLA